MDSDSDAYMNDAMSDSEDDFMASDDDAPAKAAPKKKGSVLAPKENALNAAPAKPNHEKGKTAGSKKTVEQIYQKKTQLEHILLRPDTYSK